MTFPESASPRPVAPGGFARAGIAAFLIAIAISVSVRAAGSTTQYQINRGGDIRISPDPLALDTTITDVAPGYSSTAFCAGLATRGRVSPFTSVLTSSSSVNHTSGSGSTSTRAFTDDFLITGPAGPASVTGTMYFRVATQLGESGGYPGPVPSFIQEAHFYFSVSAGVNLEFGGYTQSNSAAFTSGYGPLAGEADPDIDVVFPVTGSFPVGTPFMVELQAQTGGGTALDDTNSPGQIVANGGGANWQTNRMGLTLGDGNGVVMVLPPGYSVSSPSWNVNANQNTAVGTDRRGAPASRLRADPNPFEAGTLLRFAIANEGHHRLAVFDISGRHIRTLHDGWMAGGEQVAAWNGRDAAERAVNPGVYHVVLTGPNGAEVRRVVRVR